MNSSARQLLFLAIFIVSGAAHAHSLNDSYLQLTIERSHYSGKLQIALSDLEIAIGLDTNYNREITWGELKSARPSIDSYIQDRLSIRIGDLVCESTLGDYTVEDLSPGAYVNIAVQGSCGSAGSLSIDYGMLVDVDSSHRGIASINWDGQSSGHVFSPDKKTINIEPGSNGFAISFFNFIGEGVWHIGIGLDHILFILAMLFGVILHQQKLSDNKSYGREISFEVIKLVTAFTIAHSLTLLLSTLELVRLPVQFVESAIALSVVVGGINILFPIFGNQHWKIAFLFGLIHGFGFANVLVDLNLPATQLVAGLFGFNLGVEFGQLLIVVLAAPILVVVCNQAWTRRLGSIAGGIAISQIGLFWFLQRGIGISGI